jgi:hypothetical protein
MKMDEILKRAKDMGIETYGLSKKDLIRTIQIAEGNFPCFATAEDNCDQMKCAWRPECIAEK